MKRRRSYEYPIVYVKWEDAEFITDDSDVTDHHETFIVHAVGWLLQETEGFIVLSKEFGKKGWTRRKTVIPRGMIQEMKKIV